MRMREVKSAVFTWCHNLNSLHPLSVLGVSAVNFLLRANPPQRRRERRVGTEIDFQTRTQLFFIGPSTPLKAQAGGKLNITRATSAQKRISSAYIRRGRDWQEARTSSRGIHSIL